MRGGGEVEEEGVSGMVVSKEGSGRARRVEGEPKPGARPSEGGGVLQSTSSSPEESSSSSSTMTELVTVLAIDVVSELSSNIIPLTSSSVTKKVLT